MIYSFILLFIYPPPEDPVSPPEDSVSPPEDPLSPPSDPVSPPLLLTYTSNIAELPYSHCELKMVIPNKIKNNI